MISVSRLFHLNLLGIQIPPPATRVLTCTITQRSKAYPENWRTQDLTAQPEELNITYGIETDGSVFDEYSLGLSGRTGGEYRIECIAGVTDMPSGNFRRCGFGATQYHRHSQL